MASRGLSAAGSSRATVFRYFGSKEDILFARYQRQLKARALVTLHARAGILAHEARCRSLCRQP